MNTTETSTDYYRLTHQQQRFCDEYLAHFNAFKAAVNSGYSENTSRKGALLHVPKIQQYLKERMAARSQRLEITHDMLLRELSKIAFSNMGNYYDEYACLKRINQLTADEKAAIAYYDIVEIEDGEGYRVGMQSKIKLHNKMSALDKIARHVGFYGIEGRKNQERRVENQDNVKKEQEAGSLKQEAFCEQEAGSLKQEAFCEQEAGSLKQEAFCETEVHNAGDTPATHLERGTLTGSAKECVVVDRSADNLPMDYPEEDFELEGVELKTLIALEDVDVSPGSGYRFESEVESTESGVFFAREAGGLTHNVFEHAPTPSPKGNTTGVKNILTISPRGASLHR